MILPKVKFKSAILSAAAAIAFFPLLAKAQSFAGGIITDSSANVPNFTIFNSGGYDIAENLGYVSGPNLLHSFSQFDIETGAVATFHGSPSIQNIIARVTGGTASSIDGTITTDIANANLYFLNPNGMVFGENAIINIPGSLYLSTANQLNMADNSVIPIADTPVGTLTSAPVQSFGFLGAVTGDIVAVPRPLSPLPPPPPNSPPPVPPPQADPFIQANGDISIIASNIDLSDVLIYSTNPQNADTQIRIGSVGNNVSNVGLRGDIGNFGGIVNLTNAGSFDSIAYYLYGHFTSSDIFISGSTINITKTSNRIDYGLAMAADAYGASTDIYIKGVDLNMTDTFMIDSGAGFVNPEQMSFNVDVSGEFNLTGGGIFAGAFGQNTTMINVTANSMTMDNSYIFLDTENIGNAGNVNFNIATNFDMINNSIINSNTTGTSNAGIIDINVGGIFNLNSGSRIEAKSLTPANIGDNTNGHAGIININSGTINTDSGTNAVFSVNAVSGGRDAGQINVTTAGNASFSSNIINNWIFNATSATNGSNGVVNLDIGGDLDISYGSIAVGASNPSLTSLDQGGSGGEINIDVSGNFTLRNARLMGYSRNYNGADVNINAGSMSAIEGAITAFSLASSSGYHSGDVTINIINDAEFRGSTIGLASAALLINPALVSAGIADVGTIDIHTGGDLTFEAYQDGPTPTFSYLFAASTGTAGNDTNGRAGNIIISANNLEVSNSSFITLARSAGRDGGSIDITTNGNATFVRDITSAPAQIIETAAESIGGKGGAVSLDIGNDLYMVDAIFGTGTDGYNSFYSADGAGGDVNIQVGGDFLADGAFIDISSEIDSSGEIIINVDGDLSFDTTDLWAISFQSNQNGTSASDIIIEANNIDINSSSLNSIEAGASGAGDGGKIRIRAANNIAVNNYYISSHSTSSTSKAGDILIQATNIDLLDTWIDATSLFGTGGNILFKANQIDIAGSGDAYNTPEDILSNVSEASIMGTSGRSGTSSISFEAGQINLGGATLIGGIGFDEDYEEITPNSGNVNIVANTLNIDGAYIVNISGDAQGAPTLPIGFSYDLDKTAGNILIGANNFNFNSGIIGTSGGAGGIIRISVDNDFSVIDGVVESNIGSNNSNNSQNNGNVYIGLPITYTTPNNLACDTLCINTYVFGTNAPLPGATGIPTTLAYENESFLASGSSGRVIFGSNSPGTDISDAIDSSVTYDEELLDDEASQDIEEDLDYDEEEIDGYDYSYVQSKETDAICKAAEASSKGRNVLVEALARISGKNPLRATYEKPHSGQTSNNSANNVSDCSKLASASKSRSIMAN